MGVAGQVDLRDHDHVVGGRVGDDLRVVGQRVVAAPSAERGRPGGALGELETRWRLDAPALVVGPVRAVVPGAVVDGPDPALTERVRALHRRHLAALEAHRPGST